MRLSTLFDILYKNQQVSVVLKERVKLKIGSLDLSSLEAGTKLKLPYWIAKVLEEKGIVEVEDRGVGFDELAKALWREEHSSTLSSLSEDFYSKVRLYLERSLMPSIEGKPTRISELRQYQALLDELLGRRLQKILLVARVGISPPEYAKDMVVEERILYDRLNYVLEEWRKMVSSLTKGE
ncbi:MAG: hypothetical protein DRN15_03210 [Thermoprotei archaeon]|nr:MAG: hypothetical protein DRN15_03210 [Thermoprotei archaeon]RLF24982.1 MAG: hypothetical protein DRM97_02780 [Thermoprotei archaeon]